MDITLLFLLLFLVHLLGDKVCDLRTVSLKSLLLLLLNDFSIFLFDSMSFSITILETEITVYQFLKSFWVSIYRFSTNSSSLVYIILMTRSYSTLLVWLIAINSNWILTRIKEVKKFKYVQRLIPILLIFVINFLTILLFVFL